MHAVQEHVVFEADVDGHTVFVVGVTHFSALHPRDRAPRIESMIGESGIQAVAVEALPREGVPIEAWRDVFDTAQSGDTYNNLPSTVRKCIETAAVASPFFSGERRTALGTSHIASALFVLEQSPLLYPKVAMYLGSEFLILALANSRGIRVSALRAYSRLPRAVVASNIEAYCALLSDEQARARFAAAGHVLATDFFESGRIDDARVQQAAIWREFGFSDYSLTIADSRNARMAANIVRFAKQQSCSLAMVGALHLTGNNSIQKLLAEAGATLVRSTKSLAELRCPIKVKKLG